MDADHDLPRVRLEPEVDVSEVSPTSPASVESRQDGVFSCVTNDFLLLLLFFCLGCVFFWILRMVELCFFLFRDVFWLVSWGFSYIHSTYFCVCV